jgi:hypothetical protein
LKRLQLTPFDDCVQLRAAGSVSVTSSVEYSTVLGMFDQIAYVVTSEQISGPNPQLGVKLSHSADGRNWLPKLGSVDIPDDNVLDPSNRVPILGFDDGVIPSLRFVRFVVTLTASAAATVAVRIDATLNDVREGQFARKMRVELEKQYKSNPCVWVIQGGGAITGTSAYLNTLKSAASESDFKHGNGPLVGLLQRRKGGGFSVSPDARLCMGADGTMTLSSPGKTIQIAEASAGGPDGSSSGTGSSTC